MRDNINKDSLESFVRQNRENFDDAIPNLGIWSEIEQGLDQKSAFLQPKKRKLWKYSQIAAAAMVLLTLGGFFGNYLGKSQFNIDTPTSELVEIEAYFNKKVSEKYSQLTKLSYDKSIDVDLAQIDEVMKELREDMVNQVPGAQEKIINNLIKSYETKIKILERVLERSGEREQEQNNNNDVQISL